MFEKTLLQSVKRIFDLNKVSFDLPSDSQEQEAAFIQIDKAISRINDKRQTSRVTGKILVFANADKLPYSYLTKKIAAADAELVAPFFFYDFEENAGKFLNIVERSLSFVFFFDSQYNPDVGTMTEVVFE